MHRKAHESETSLENLLIRFEESQSGPLQGMNIGRKFIKRSKLVKLNATGALAD